MPLNHEYGQIQWKPITVNKAHKNLEAGANIFMGNLDAEIDDLLYDNF